MKKTKSENKKKERLRQTGQGAKKRRGKKRIKKVAGSGKERKKRSEKRERDGKRKINRGGERSKNKRGDKRKEGEGRRGKERGKPLLRKLKIKNEFRDKEMILSLEFTLSLIIYNADKFHKG